MVTSRTRGRFSGNGWSPTPAVAGLLLALLVIYLASGFAANFAPAVAVAFSYLPLETERVLDGQVWRVVTYGLLHSLQSPFHLIMNGMVLFFFARDLEQRWGSLRLLGFVLLTVVIGGLFVVGSKLIGIGIGNAIGISAASEAALVTWALFNRDRPVLLFFVAPVRGIYLIVLAIVFWMMDAVSMSGISAAAHAGGMLTGFAVWGIATRRNRLRLFFDDVLVALRLRKKTRLTVVPKNDKWVN